MLLQTIVTWANCSNPKEPEEIIIPGVLLYLKPWDVLIIKRKNGDGLYLQINSNYTTEVNMNIPETTLRISGKGSIIDPKAFEDED